MSPGESYICNCQSTEWTLRFQCGQWVPIRNSQIIGRYKEMSPGESYGQWELIWSSQLIGRYKEMSPGESYIWNWQSSEWTLHFSMQSMRAHLKQSTNRKIKEMSPGESYIWNRPRAQSELLLFNAVNECPLETVK